MAQSVVGGSRWEWRCPNVMDRMPAIPNSSDMLLTAPVARHPLQFPRNFADQPHALPVKKPFQRASVCAAEQEGGHRQARWRLGTRLPQLLSHGPTPLHSEREIPLLKDRGNFSISPQIHTVPAGRAPGLRARVPASAGPTAGEGGAAPCPPVRCLPAVLGSTLTT